MKKSILLTDTLELLESSSLSAKEIAKGVGCTTRWIHYLKEGRYKDPGVNKIQMIHDFLVAAKSKSDFADAETLKKDAKHDNNKQLAA